MHARTQPKQLQHKIIAYNNINMSSPINIELIWKAK